MKVLIVSPLLPSPSIPMRGVRTFAPLTRLHDMGHEVRAVVPVASVLRFGRGRKRLRSIPPFEHDRGAPVSHPRYHSLGVLSRIPGTARLDRAAFWRAVRPEVETYLGTGGRVVHAHSAALPGALGPHLGEAKLIVSMHDDELFDLVPNRADWRAAVSETLRTADCVVYVSEVLRDIGTELAGPHRARVVPLGIDEYPDVTVRPAREFHVVTAARLIARKHIDDVIEAFGRLILAGPGRLTVVGDGPERGRLEALVEERGLADSVTLTGAVPRDRVAEIMATAHLFALPSVRESLGTVYLEAMSLGVPCVAVRGEGISRYISDGIDGFLIEARDVRALAEAMRSVRDDPGRHADLSAKARARFDRSGVRWTDYVDAHLAIYRSLGA